jgi:hypothetical protein
MHGIIEQAGADVVNILLDTSDQEDEQLLGEALPETSDAFIYVAMSRLMARRLAPS